MRRRSIALLLPLLVTAGTALGQQSTTSPTRYAKGPLTAPTLAQPIAPHANPAASFPQPMVARMNETHATAAPVTPTENMWFYDQAQRHYHNPKEMVRRNAEQEAAQRHSRIAALEWYGYSNSPPS